MYISSVLKRSQQKDYRRLSVSAKQTKFNHHVSWDCVYDKHIVFVHFYWTKRVFTVRLDYSGRLNSEILYILALLYFSLQMNFIALLANIPYLFGVCKIIHFDLELCQAAARLH